MNQDELIAKLTPAIGLRRQLNPRINPASAECADPILAVRQLYPSERTCSDETLDTILLEHEIDAKHEHPYGLLAASSHAIRLTWFPGSDPTTMRLLAEGISLTAHKPIAYVQILHGSEEQIAAAIDTAKAVEAWTDEVFTT